MDEQLKPGTNVLISTAAAEPETGRALRWRKINGDRQQWANWEIVHFDSDGARLCVHHSGLTAL